MDYMKRKTREYEQLKREWTARVTLEDLEFIRGNVLKDVLRTDRAHPYYAGSEDSPHLTALTDLLTTFAITHPQVSRDVLPILGLVLLSSDHLSSNTPSLKKPSELGFCCLFFYLTPINLLFSDPRGCRRVEGGAGT